MTNIETESLSQGDSFVITLSNFGDLAMKGFYWDYRNQAILSIHARMRGEYRTLMFLAKESNRWFIFAIDWKVIKDSIIVGTRAVLTEKLIKPLGGNISEAFYEK